MSSLNVLVVDDEPAIRQVLSTVVRKGGHAADTASSASEAAQKLAKGEFDVVLSDIAMPVMDGIELLRHVRGQGIDAPFIMVTAYASVHSAIDAIKAGAYDYITKPVQAEEILLRLSQIQALRGLREENQALRRFALPGRDAPFRFACPAMQEVERLVTRVAPTPSTVLITGESGTGKSVTARHIHELSARREQPFIPVNCSAIPENLLESEFFGHTKGAFTSADRSRKGLFLQADRGTIFLDEIGDLPLPLQTKLLHVIEERAVRALGSEQLRKVDVRIVTATNRDLATMVAEGRFREDLYFRLSVFHIAMPPLRLCLADLPGLVQFLLERQHAATDGAQALTLDPEAQEVLAGYEWPGNVRQLENVLQRAAILADGGRITVSDLPPELTRPGPAKEGASVSPPRGGSLRENVRRFELALIQRAIEEAGGDRKVAAQRLGIGLSSLYRKLEEYQSDDRGESQQRNGLQGSR